MIPNGPDYDQEVISEEERIMFRKVGLKMKAYLPLGESRYIKQSGCFLYSCSD